MNNAVWRTFLKPGWVLTAVAVIVFAYVAFTILAPWQLHKNDTVSSRNHQIEAAFQTEPVPWAELVDAAGNLPADREWRQVRLTGHYLPEAEVLLRLRPVNSHPAFQALTPFALEDGRTVLVNRGFVAPVDGGVPPIETAPSGTVVITGYARLDEPTPQNPPLVDEQRVQVTGINSEQISRETGVELARDYVQLGENQPGVLQPIPLPQLDAGPHLSYGVQWIAFGIMAPLGLAYFVWAEMRERRREAQENTNEQPEAAVESVGESVVESVSAESEKPRARTRYGSSRVDHYSKIAKRNEERF